MLTPSQIAAVRQSFALIRPNAERAAAQFYDRLFALDPKLRPLFPRDLAPQGRKLMQMLGVAVANLDRVEALMPRIRALGARHAGYGVKDAHYDAAGGALLWTLEQNLRERFTPELRTAWIAAYTLVAEAMKDAAKSPASSAAA